MTGAEGQYCGVRPRRLLGRWWHVQRLGPVPCSRPEPEDAAESL